MLSTQKVAAIQLASGPDLDANLTKTQTLIKEAVDAGAALIVLPENFACMGVNEDDKLKIAETYGTGPIQSWLSNEAKSNHVWIIAGTMPIVSNEASWVYASSLVFDNQGVCVARYDKIHLFDVEVGENAVRYRESDAVMPGTTPVVVDTPVGRVGLSVCYDLRFPELFRTYVDLGVTILSIPSAFTYVTGEAHWDPLIRTRAIENLSYVVAPNQCGRHYGRHPTYGHSAIVNHWGDYVGQLDLSPGIIVKSLDLASLKSVRAHFPAIHHRKKFAPPQIVEMRSQ